VAARVRFAGVWLFADAVAGLAVRFLAGAGGVFAAAAFRVAFAGDCLTVRAVDVVASRFDRRGAGATSAEVALAVRVRAGRGAAVTAGCGVA
jgi:hypothetical protein